MRITSMDRERIRQWLPSGWLGWCAVWSLLVVAIVAAGAIAGSVLYPLVGTLLQMELSVREMFINGVFDGGFYALIWAPGVSFVACIMGAHWKNRNRAG
jgi:hypothetical protein